MRVRLMVMSLKMRVKVVYKDQDEGDEDECGECEHDKGDVCDQDEDEGILMLRVTTMQLRGIVKVMSDHHEEPGLW